jgi:hypothetical protein
MIYSLAFSALDAKIKALVYRRLLVVLTGKDQSPLFSNLSSGGGKAALGILRATSQDLSE